MARIRAQQAGKRSWLQRIFLPLHIKLPLEAIALLMVCVSGYYLSRTVESDLKPSSRQQLQEHPAQQSPLPVQPSAQLPATGEQTDRPAAVQPQTTVPTVPTVPAVPAAPKPSPRQDSTPAAPAPAAYRDRYGSKTEALKAAPPADPYNRALEAAPEMRSKASRILERQTDAAAPATAGRAAGAAAGPALPQAVVRLSVDDPSTAAALIRETLLRSGGDTVDERELQGRRLKARIPAARQKELLERLERLGRVVERPATFPEDARHLEITVQW
jgi:hypothetical protein